MPEKEKCSYGMASKLRAEKINILLREEVARILDRELEFPEGSLITITRSEISDDNHYAAVFVSILDTDPKRALEILGKNIYHIQQLLNRRLKMRPIPKIHFAIDEGEIRRETVEKSVAELKKKGEI